ncbi:FecR family protein [Pedobacter nyackensis]|uniref:FecR family protein n=1 Tax=Pedobacter nyackensis TaxID=475255 RepID=UPI002930EE06|nr:FecR domain-containing protein [Pedobacter nyackensis]
MTDELLIRFLLKETSEEENITVQNWIDAAPSNKDHFLKFEKLWNSSKNLAPQSTISENEAWLRFKQKTVAYKQPAVKNLNPIKKWLKIAAVLFVIAAGWSVYSILSPVSYTSFSAGNKVATKMLPDGSELTLNKNSSVSYASNFKNNRSIHLKQGDVFFNVVHDKTKPFIIEIDEVSVLVVGTSFNIKHLNDQTEVIVETGVVKVSLGTEEISLQKGEKVVISKSSTKLIKAQNTDQLYDYYRSNEFVTNNTPLSRLLEVFNEAYGANIIINDETIKNLTINTTFKTTASLETNLQVICRTLDLTLIRNQNQIILSNHQ